MALHPAVQERIDRLTPDQRAAATAPPGPLLCLAPAGSGKTTTLVARIAWLVDTGAEPASITAVTFNKRAAMELEERLVGALGPLGAESGAVRVRTFHALGREILRDAGVDVLRLVDRAEVLAELAGRPLPPARLRRLEDAFSRIKLDGTETPATEVRRAFLRYDRALRERGAIDFDDLVRLALERVETDAALRERWRARTAHLLVDEVQDTDRAQLRLALTLAAPANRLFLVGDDDQTIYAWRLADVRRLLDLARSLPGLQRVDLSTNHRCPAPVVRRAVRLVEHNRERFTKRIEPRADAPGTLLLAPDPGDDVARARRLLEPLVRDQDARLAVLARTNAELVPFAAVALELGVPYAVDDDGLGLLDGPYLDEALTAAEALLPTLPLRSPLLALLAVQACAPRAARPAVAALLGWMPGLRRLADLRGAIASARERREHLRSLSPRLTLATAHGTKGLEFDTVACVGLDEGRFPSARSVAEAESPERALEEERRLGYVAWTRARRTLILVFDPGAPSPFLREAFEPEELEPVA